MFFFLSVIISAALTFCNNTFENDNAPVLSTPPDMLLLLFPGKPFYSTSWIMSLEHEELQKINTKA